MLFSFPLLRYIIFIKLVFSENFIGKLHKVSMFVTAINALMEVTISCLNVVVLHVFH